jgi:hypothetical protein
MTDTLNLNFDEVPDEMPDVKPGVYEGEVVDAEAEVLETKNGPANTVKFQLKVTRAEDEENEAAQGLSVYDRIFLSTERDYTKLKQFYASAEGKSVSDITGSRNIEDLQGSVVKFVARKDNKGYTKVGKFVPAE